MTTGKRVTVEDFKPRGRLGFRLVWSVEDYWADVRAYAIVAMGTDESGDDVWDVPLFLRRGARNSADNVEDVNEAEPYLQAFVKWDGCSELDLGRPHFCGPESFKDHCDLLRHIYVRAGELMGGIDEAWNDD